MVEKEYMSWEQYEKNIEEFLKILTFIETNDVVILGIKRGGLPTAVSLSNKLNVPISLVTFQTRDGSDAEPNFLEPELIESAKVIIVPDDIYDSGLTINKIVSELKVRFDKTDNQMVLLFHYASNHIFESNLKNYKHISLNDGKWIVFPWE